MNIDTKFLLVCLQLIIVLLMSTYVEGLADMGSRRRMLSDPVANLSQSSSETLSSKYTVLSTSPVTRAYRLHNLRAKADVVMDKHNRVSATALNSDERGDLGLESVIKNEEVRTRIRGLVSDTYLCFNQKGRLVSKPKGRARGAKCEFIEQVNPESGSSSFKSVLNPSWHVGFNLKGRSLLGSSYEGSECLDCFLFYKTSINTRSRKNPPPTHLTHRNFSPLRHNQRVGQIHPGLNDDFLSSFSFPLQPQFSNWRRPATLTTTTTPPPPSKPTTRHRLRHRNKKHRHQHHHVQTTQTPPPHGSQL